MSLALIPCPLCGEAARFLSLSIPFEDTHIGDYRELYGSKVKSEWKACGQCAFVHQNPRPSTADLNAFYERGEYHQKAKPPLAWNDREVYMKFARWYYDDKVKYALEHSSAETGRVLEVGFGYGGALALFAERGWTVEGREPDPRLVEFSRTVLGLDGVEQGLVDEKLDIEPVDIIWSNHAFEHIADLHGVMAALRKVIKPGGIIFTAIPTYAANRSDMSLQWMNAAHYSMFTEASLSQLMAHHGFETVVSTYRGWRKEIDDLWHIARYTGAPLEPSKHYEKPTEVAHYIDVVNPRRSRLLWPLFHNYAKKYQRAKYVKDSLALVARKLVSLRR